MVALYKEDGIQILSKGWFELNDSSLFVAKQVTTWGGPNSGQHSYFLRQISFTKKNFLKWQVHLFRQRPSATIQTFSFAPGRQSIRISYDLAIGIYKPTSSDVINGKSGSNKKYSNIDFLSYCLVIEYAKIANQDLLSKIG
jgi:hypothetical protein